MFICPLMKNFASKILPIEYKTFCPANPSWACAYAPKMEEACWTLPFCRSFFQNGGRSSFQRRQPLVSFLATSWETPRSSMALSAARCAALNKAGEVVEKSAKPKKRRECFPHPRLFLYFFLFFSKNSLKTPAHSFSNTPDTTSIL